MDNGRKKEKRPTWSGGVRETHIYGAIPFFFSPREKQKKKGKKGEGREERRVFTCLWKEHKKETTLKGHKKKGYPHLLKGFSL